MTRHTHNPRPRAAGPFLGAVVATVLLLSSCSADTNDSPGAAQGSNTTTTTSSAATAATTTTTRPVDLIGSMDLDRATGPAGTPVRVSASDLPPELPLRLVWATSECTWVLKGDQREEYHGRQCDPKDVDLAKVSSDASGALAASFVVPGGFGFGHDVLLLDEDGVVRNKALFDVTMRVDVSPRSGTVGTPITVTVEGMGVDALENNRQILYDNAYTGWLSAITTDGTATAVIPATGSPGPHVIQVARGAFTFPYLNPGQSPRPDIPVFDFPFTVTDGPPILPPPAASQSPAPQSADAPADASGPSISTDVARGPVGTDVTVSGAGFPASTDVKLQWFRIVGNRVAGLGWEERSVDLPSVRSGADGSFEMGFAIPGDVGGAHRIEATAGGKSATTSVTITPAAATLTASGPVGTPFSIQLTGVGWTETANIYTVVYDNRYIGYVCGFNSQGDVTIPLLATGDPGWHYIDLYPAIYKGEERDGQQSFRIPQLTYAVDHPGEQLPAFHFAVEVTG